MSDNITKILLMGKSYPIRCPEDKVASLQQAAILLDQKLQELKLANPQNNLEKIAITAALNLAHDLIQAREHGDQNSQALETKLRSMHADITDVLTEQAEF